MYISLSLLPISSLPLTQVAFVSVEQLSYLAEWSQEIAQLSTNLVSELITSLCKGIATLLTQSRRVLVVHHLVCLSRWVSYAPPHTMHEPGLSGIFYETVCNCSGPSNAPEVNKRKMGAGRGKK